MDHYQRGDNTDNNNIKTINKDGRKLAVINADDLDDGIIIVPGHQ